MFIAAILLSGGVGKRVGSNIPKQFLKIGNKKIIEYSYEKLINNVDFLVIVSHKDYIEETKKIFNDKKKILIVEGGETRQLSVFNGLNALKGINNLDLVVIHDSARPFFSIDLLYKCIDTAKINDSAIPAIKESNTVAYVENNKVFEYLDRNKIYLIQTPQVFKYDVIFGAHKIAFDKRKFDYTDDSQIIRLINKDPFIVEGEEKNIKITNKFDILLAETILKYNN